MKRCSGRSITSLGFRASTGGRWAATALAGLPITLTRLGASRRWIWWLSGSFTGAAPDSIFLILKDAFRLAACFDRIPPGLQPRKAAERRDCWPDGWNGGVAASHGIRYLLRPTSAVRNLLRGGYGIPDLGAGRIENSDRRTNWGVCRGGCGHHRQARRAGLVCVYFRRRDHACVAGHHRHGHGGEVYTTPGSCGIHQLHFIADCQNPDLELLRAPACPVAYL